MSRLLRSQFTAYPEGNLHFWNCPSDAKWFIQASVHDDAVRTQYPVAEQMRISLDALSQRNSKTCLEEWIVEFSRGETRGRNFLTLNTEATPTYAKGGTWMSYLGHFISLCARATRAILNHAPIGEYRARFFPQKTCPCGQSDRRHILTDCPRFAKDRVSLPSPCIGDFIKFLISNSSTFTFPTPREPPWAHDGHPMCPLRHRPSSEWISQVLPNETHVLTALCFPSSHSFLCAYAQSPRQSLAQS